MAPFIKKQSKELDHKATARNGPKVKRDPEGPPRPSPNSSIRPKHAARPKHGPKPAARRSAGEHVGRGGPKGPRLVLFMRELDVLAGLEVQFEDRPPVKLCMGRGPAAMLALMIAAVHQSSGDLDEGRWICDLDYAARLSALFGVPVDPCDGNSDVLKKHIFKLRETLARAVHGRYEGAARDWAHRVVVHDRARGYGLDLPAGSLWLVILKPSRRFPSAPG